MNYYFHISFYNIYNFIRVQKLILIFPINNFFLANNIRIFRYFFKNIFKIHTLVKKRKKNLKFNRKKYKFSFFKFYSSTVFNFKIIKNNVFFFIFFNRKTVVPFFSLLNISNWEINYKIISIYFLNIYKKTFGEGFLYIRGLLIIFFIDACLTDDEPLWEPVEWSLVQTWIFFIFVFAWIAENLITSRYGSYTGRDKRVWFAWYKTFWLIELWYALCYGATSMFVIVPFYYELTYSVSFIFSWWHWYNRIFFFKFISTLTIVLLISHFFQLNVRWMNWKKSFLMVLVINFFILYMLYTQFIITFFGYFTDPLWYQKTRFIDYIQLSHEPLKWGWGPAKRDHFTYHKISTVFWFKNDGPFASAFLMINLFFFLTIFFLLMYWLTLLRRIYTTKEVTYTFSTYCVSALKQFFYFFFLFYILIFISFIVCYWRFPIEFLWILNKNSWFFHFFLILKDYLFFIFYIF